MTAQEHLDVARHLWELARELIRRDRVIAAAEMLWGAANRIILAINLRYQIIPAGRPLRRRTLLRHLEQQNQRGHTLRRGLDAVGKLHGHFYNSNLSVTQLAAHFQEAEAFIAALFNLPETGAISQA